MLTRNCEHLLGSLLGEDFNVRVTVAPKLTGELVTKSAIDGAWKEWFRDSIGGGIIHDSMNLYDVDCITENGIFEFSCAGNLLVSNLWEYVKDVDAARINIVKAPYGKNKVHSWIVIRNDFEVKNN